MYTATHQASFAAKLDECATYGTPFPEMSEIDQAMSAVEISLDVADGDQDLARDIVNESTRVSPEAKAIAWETFEHAYRG